MKINVAVGSRKRSHLFSVVVHKVSTLLQFQLEIDEFYVNYGKRIPPFPHYELEIEEPGLAYLANHKLHVHRAPVTGKLFVCFPCHISSPEDALSIFSVWCVGTVGKIDEGIDMNPIFTDECRGDRAKFLRIMEERHGIQLTGAGLVD